MTTKRTIGAVLALGVSGGGLGSVGGRAYANFVSYQCGLEPPVFVVDQDPGDDDAAEDRIEHSFACDVDAGVGAWHAEGTLLGVFGPPDTAGTELRNVTIENTAGNVQAQLFRVEHVFQSPLGPPPPLHTVVIAGHYDSFASDTVQGAKLNYDAFVYALDGSFETILSGRFPADGSIINGPAPIPFADAGGPVSINTPIRHRLDLLFYLDSPGDAIVFGEDEGFDAESNPIPEPGTGLLLLVAGAIRRRRG